MTPTPKIPLAKIKAIAIYLLKIIVLAVVYHLAARLGLKMPYVQVNPSPVWLPTGIALAALLTFSYKFWPGISPELLARAFGHIGDGY